MLAGGFDSWVHETGAIVSIPLVDPAGAAAAPGIVLDVRQHEEFVAGHVRGAVNVELGELAHTPVPAGPVTVMCGHGERAMTGASLLARAGRHDVQVLAGGPHDWARVTGAPLVTGR